MIGTPTTTNVAHDLIDHLLHASGGEVLSPRRPGVHAGGEYDYVTDGHLTTRSLRRLSAAGLISSHGMPADRLADVCGWEGDVSSFVEHWCTTGLAGLDARAERRSGGEWCERVEAEPDDAPTVGDLPGAVLEYLLRLVFADKAEYAAAYAYHVVHAAPLPADPGTDWAGKARRKVDQLVGRK